MEDSERGPKRKRALATRLSHSNGLWVSGYVVSRLLFTFFSVDPPHNSLVAPKYRLFLSNPTLGTSPPKGGVLISPLQELRADLPGPTGSELRPGAAFASDRHGDAVQRAPSRAVDSFNDLGHLRTLRTHEHLGALGGSVRASRRCLWKSCWGLLLRAKCWGLISRNRRSLLSPFPSAVAVGHPGTDKFV